MANRTIFKRYNVADAEADIHIAAGYNGGQGYIKGGILRRAEVFGRCKNPFQRMGACTRAALGGQGSVLKIAIGFAVLIAGQAILAGRQVFKIHQFCLNGLYLFGRRGGNGNGLCKGKRIIVVEYDIAGRNIEFDLLLVAGIAGAGRHFNTGIFGGLPEAVGQVGYFGAQADLAQVGRAGNGAGDG